MEAADQSFRDHIVNEDAQGKYKRLYPKKPAGYFHNLRVKVTIVLLAIFFILPILQWNGQPFFMLNIFDRKFILFGNIFWPQDTYLLIFLLLIFFVFIILFTVGFGRIWCGWACPQTLFMEMVFRKIEYWIEGSHTQQLKRDKGPWTFDKIKRKVAKHTLFIAVSLIIAHTVMAYLVGLPQTWEIIQQGPTKHLSGFIGLLVFTTLFYIVFSVVREHVCTYICPYGRLQSVLINKETLVVAYDYKRGEPKGKVNTAGRGSCVDCGLCVQVCPTGIDIRNGTQLECVNCTACMDACDEVMDKTHQPRGLIRIDSIDGIESQKKRRFTPKMMAYTAVLTVLSIVFVTLIVVRKQVQITVNRVPGQLYQKLPDGGYSNLYNVIVLNKSNDSLPVTIKPMHSNGKIRWIGNPPAVLPGQGKLDMTFFLDLPAAEVQQMQTEVELGVYKQNELINTVDVSFLGPATTN